MIPAERAHLFVAAQSHKGMKKGKNNEDRYAISSYLLGEDDSTPTLFAIVADGIGGHLAGEIAAEMVVDYVSQAIAEGDTEDPLKSIKEAVEGANQAVANLSEKDEKKQGMGATCVCAWIVGNRLYAGSVGDSRLYLMRGAVIQQLTTDHTWIQEALDKGVLTPEQARDHPNAHVIRQYVGGQNPPEVDFRLRLHADSDDEEGKAERKNQGLRLKAGDSLLLCSDGLTDLVWNDEILEIVRSSKNLEAAAQKLVDTANQRGGHDNITVVLLSVPKKGKGLINKSKPPLALIVGGVIAFLFALSVVIGFAWYMLQPPTTPTPTATLISTPMPLSTTAISNTPTLSPPSTSTPRPTLGATYTPWPTNTPDITSTPTSD
ncbi:MAG: serine/threonine-protein phosphatase [Anaerolineae bacterium]|jgi:protein phosphatase|nr:serine/threonine-protein phosphatase [Anaerolineae bacterium]MBT3712089.1 serine/threonine-protein phosphatase [Anaerolineae bacterium]MBT4310289.1 serine/threonine-protein phosphatase [Anaerolineae bacterium]MBT4459040.1 serine/threonine-protein phosphatase [Anaerolineae bacterium]MBT6060130.1 serine/threonine-protein phosphatase [Anaerolineae bacterium]